MNYTLHQLQVFLKVAETQSITKAAQELHLTQPAVSIQIKNLQEQFEIPIVEIVGRQLFVTQFGKEIVEAAKTILDEINIMNSKAAAYRGHLIGQLKITVVSTGKYVIPFFLTDFMKQHKGIELLLDVTNRAKVINSLERNEVDFALVSVLPEQLQVEQVELMENKLYLVGSKNQKFNPSGIDKKIFEEVPLIYREEGSGTRSILEKFMRTHNFSAVKKMELTSNEAVKQAVIADLGFSIMPLIGISNELKRGDLKIIPFKGFPIRTQWTLIWLKRKRLSPVADAYRQFIQKEKAKIIKQKFDLIDE